jgi:hypothetical protein
MSDAAVNPFQGPNYEPSYGAKDLGPAKRPTGLLIFCVLILALASLGFLGSLFGGIMLAANGGKMDYKQQLGSQPNAELNPEVIPRLDALGPSHATRQIVTTVGGIVVSLLLIIGAVSAIYPFRFGGAILTLGCIAAIVYLITQGVFTMMIMQDIVAILKDHPDDFFIPNDNADERQITMINQILKITYTVIPIVTWVFNALKIIFYASLIAYLRKQNVRAFISGTPV